MFLDSTTFTPVEIWRDLFAPNVFPSAQKNSMPPKIGPEAPGSSSMSPSYAPINPFLGNGRYENFPPLDKFYDDEESESVPDTPPSNSSHISLNLSIDTLARIKPVDISNLSDFLKEKEMEEDYEVGS